MAAAYGLYSHIQSNKRRSIALLIGLFFLVYVMVYAGALLAEGLTHDAGLAWLLRKAFQDLIWAAPWATLGAAETLSPDFRSTARRAVARATATPSGSICPTS